jgi:hypothetical protein
LAIFTTDDEYLFLFFITADAALHASLNPFFFAQEVNLPWREAFIDKLFFLAITS